jgi:hypothetical protein
MILQAIANKNNLFEYSEMENKKLIKQNTIKLKIMENKMLIKPKIMENKKPIKQNIIKLKIMENKKPIKLKIMENKMLIKFRLIIIKRRIELMTKYLDIFNSSLMKVYIFFFKNLFADIFLGILIPIFCIDLRNLPQKDFDYIFFSVILTWCFNMITWIVLLSQSQDKVLNFYLIFISIMSNILLYNTCIFFVERIKDSIEYYITIANCLIKKYKINSKYAKM